MRCEKIFLYVVLIFFAATLSGCKGFGKAFVRGTTRAAVNVAVDNMRKDDNFDRSSRQQNSSTKPTLRTGALVTGGALVANEIVSEAPVPADLTAKDLSLGALTIDDPAEKVQAVLGRPYAVKTDAEGYTRLSYRDVEVVLFNGKIQALVSQSPAFATPRGIREGSSFCEVVDRYGTNYVESPYTVDTLYEYEITSANGNPCYLRFAVTNIDGKVKYISERFVQ